MQVSSILNVTSLSGKSEQVEVSGAGQETINFLRSNHVISTKFVFKGFIINGKFKPFRWYR